MPSRCDDDPRTWAGDVHPCRGPDRIFAAGRVAAAGARRRVLLLGTAACALIAAACTGASAQQATSTWQGAADVSYTNAANWAPNLVPLTPGRVAAFVASSHTAVNLSDGTAAAPDGLTFTGTTAYTLTVSNGSALRLGGIGLANGSSVNQTLVLNNGTLSLPAAATGAQTSILLGAGGTDVIEGGAYAGSIIGSGDLTKTTAGRLLLGGTDSSTGTTIVSAGTLDVAGTIGQGAALVNAAAVVIEAGAAATFTGRVTNAGSLTNGGALTGASIVNQAGATFASVGTLSASTFTNDGAARLAGTLNQIAIGNAGSITVTGALGGTSNLANAAGGSVTVGAGSYTGIGTLTNGGSVTVGAGTLSATTLSNQAGASLVSAGSLTAVSLSNAGTLQLSGTLTTPSLTNTGTLTVTGPLAGASNVTNTGGGVVAVGGSSFSGIGTLTNGASVTIGSGSLSAQAVSNGAGATLTGGGSLAVGTLGNAGTVDLSGSLTAAAVNNAGVFAVTGVLGGATTSFNNAAGGTLQVGDGSFSGLGTLNNAGAVTIRRGVLSATVVSDAAGSSVVSTGGVTATTVNNAGTLALAGTLAAGTVNNTGAVTVTGALGGSTGTFNNAAAATLQIAGGSFSGLGTLVNQGQVTVGGGSLTAVTLTNAGRASVAGTLNAATVNNTGSFIVTGQLGGTLGTFNQQQGTFDAGGNTATVGTLSLTGGTVTDGTVRADLFALQSGTVGASLAGPGSLAKTGTGTVTLSAVNTFTGATTLSGGRLSLVDGGAIALSAGVRDDAILDISGTAAGAAVRTLSGTGAVVLGGQTLTLTDAADSFSGRITGAGGVVLVSGRESLTAPSAYTGGTVVEGGVLAVGDARAIGTGTLRLDRDTVLSLAADQLDLANEVVLAGQGRHGIDSGAFATAIGGRIGGAGRLTKIGQGQLTLSAGNSYRGGTTVLGGTLVGSATSFGSGTIRDAAALVLQQPTDADFANAMAGEGTLTKRGAGALDLTGQSPLSGPTLVQAGTLIVDGGLSSSVVTLGRGTTLAGTGTVGGIVAGSGSVVQPGLRTSKATLNATGPVSFAPGSTLRVGIDAAGGTDRISTAGAGTLTGGTVDVLASAGIYSPAARYTLLAARQGVTGRFSGLTTTSNLVFLQPFLIYSPSSVILAFAQQPFVSAARTGNDRATAGALQSLGPAAFAFIGTSAGNAPGDGDTGAPGYNAATLYYALLGQDAAGALQALRALSGEVHASSVTAALEDSRFVREAILDHLRETADEAARPGARTSGTSPYGAWGQAFGDFGRSGGDHRGAAALDRSIGGFVLGADGRLPAFLGAWSLGIAGGYTNDAIDVSRRASAGTVESVTAGLYAGARYGAVDLRLGSVAGGIRTDLGRTIAFPGFLDAARSSSGGTIVQGFGEAGYRVAMGGAVVEPLFTAAAMHLGQAAFTETGGPAALVGAARGYDLETTTLGVRSERAFWGEASIFAHAFLGWRHAFGDVRPGTLVSFASGSTAFAVEGVPVARDALSIQAGLDWRPFDGVTVAGLYSGQVGARADDHALKGQLEYRF